MNEPQTSGTEPRRSTSVARAVRVLALTAASIFAIDLATKHLALQQLTDSEPVRLLGGAVYLTLTRNSGAAFSIGSDYTFIFPIITLLVIGWIGWMARRLRSVPWAVALGLVLGGATGNLADRLFRAPGPFMGHVVDMVSLFDDHGQVWPVFNVADSSLMTGVALAILLELTGRQRDGRRLGRETSQQDAKDPGPTAHDRGSGATDSDPTPDASTAGSAGAPRVGS